MRDEKVFQRKAGRIPLHLIIRSTIMILDGSWRIEQKKPAIAPAQTTQPGYDYLFTINGHNHLIYPDDLHLIHSIEKDPEHATKDRVHVRLISSVGTINQISFSGRFFIQPFAPAITSPYRTSADRTAEVLRDKQLKLEIAQRAGRVGIWTYDPVTREGMATKELIELTGYGGASETWKLENFLSLLDDEDSAAVKEAFDQARENDGIEVECRILHRDRGLKWVLIRGSYFPAEKGEHDSIMGSLIDITERKALEEQKDEFIAIASHELKTPVTSIKAYAEILLDFLRSKRDSAHTSMMERMVSQADRLTRLINDLLDTSKITSGMLHLEPVLFDMNMLIRERVDEIKQTTKHVFIIHPGDIPLVRADKDRISQVLNNLITNAIKYSPETSTIAITSRATASSVTVSVRDSGIGLTKAAQQRIFERFYRVNAAAHIGIPGMGLGLYIAHEIIRKHHGVLQVRSIPGEGSEFSFRLPAG